MSCMCVRDDHGSCGSPKKGPTCSYVARHVAVSPLLNTARRAVPGVRHQTMAFRINPLVAALPVLVLGPGACSAVATSGRFGDRNVLEAEPAAEVRARHTADAVCCHAPACCWRAPRVGGLINWHLSWQASFATILRTMPTRASVPGAIFGACALREHVPSRHLIVEEVGAGCESAGIVCAFGAVRLICRGLGAKEGPFSSGGRYRLEYFSHAPEWLYVKDLRTRAH